MAGDCQNKYRITKGVTKSSSNFYQRLHPLKCLNMKETLKVLLSGGLIGFTSAILTSNMFF